MLHQVLAIKSIFACFFISFFRRDKAYCHECRYCCTLSVCTKAEGFSWGSIYLHSNKSLEEALLKGLLNGAPSAIVGFSTDTLMYKNFDFRCLKPKEGIPIEEWPHYEMYGFRAAKTKEELDKVKEIPFDKYFFNFEDPEVLNDLTDGSDDALDLWKKTYGFDWAAWTVGHGGNESITISREHCLEAEYGSYAQECKKNGGFFKCCVTGFRMDQYHMIRYKLKKRSLINEGPNSLYCGEYDGQGFCYIALGKMLS